MFAPFSSYQRARCCMLNLYLSYHSNTEAVLASCLHVFRQAGPPKRVDCLTPRKEIALSDIQIKFENYETKYSLSRVENYIKLFAVQLLETHPKFIILARLEVTLLAKSKLMATGKWKKDVGLFTSYLREFLVWFHNIRY